ncbi:MAG: hypothetical protein V2A73_14480 [Pseudomonadota bacterium]
MKHLSCFPYFAAFLATATGACNLELDPDPQDPNCAGIVVYRNPASGECVGVDHCEGTNAPPWGICSSPCNDMDEAGCLATGGCQTIYANDQTVAPSQPRFLGCWAAAFEGLEREGGCVGLNAQGCAAYDSCVALHFSDESQQGGIGKFDSCVDEPGPLCEEEPEVVSLRNPATGLCESFLFDPCGRGQTGDGLLPVPGMPDWGACFDRCSELREGACLTAEGCRAAYLVDESMAEGRAPEFLGCWATAPSGPVQGDNCIGLSAQACSRHDDCFAYYSRGQGESRAIGQFAFCGQEQPLGCEEIGDEVTCIETSGCAPTYIGGSCSCDESGCACNSTTFLGCVGLLLDK